MMRFSQFIGNEDAARAMQSAIGRSRVANAYLLAGPEGVGKRTLALLCAQSILCPDFDGEPCGRCLSCGRFDAGGDEPGAPGSHPDFVSVGPAAGKFIRVDQIRSEIIAASQMRPRESARQVFLVDPADAMNPSASNAFLKTLEEAPGGSVFFLLTSRPVALLPTIRSRCQLLALRPMDSDALANSLRERGIERQAADTIAMLSAGAPGRALEFDLEEYRSERELALQFARLALGASGVEQIFALAATLHAEPERFTPRLQQIQTLLRDLMLLASAGAAVRIVNSDISRQLVELAREQPARSLARLLSAVADMQEPLLRNVRIDSIVQELILQGRKSARSHGAAPA